MTEGTVRKELGKLKTRLRARKLKTTRTRQLIFAEIVASRHVHPNAGDIQRRLRAKGHRVSLATIYRTLRLLVESGLVSQVDLGEDHSHYEAEGPKAGHGHLICLSCGIVMEFTDGGIHKTIGAIGASRGFALDKSSIQVFGYCRKCRKG